MAIFNRYVEVPEVPSQLSMNVFYLFAIAAWSPHFPPIEGEPRELTESTEPGADWDGICREVSAASAH